MNTNCRKDCRRVARCKHVPQNTRDALKIPCGAAKQIICNGLRVFRMGGGYAVYDFVTRCLVYHEAPAHDIREYHDGLWTRRLEDLANEQRAAAKFSC